MRRACVTLNGSSVLCEGFYPDTPVLGRSYPGRPQRDLPCRLDGETCYRKDSQVDLDGFIGSDNQSME